MSKMFTRTYVSKICPELLLSEVDIVYEEVLVNSHPDDVYPKQVRDTAERMFPGIIKPRKEKQVVEATRPREYTGRGMASSWMGS